MSRAAAATAILAALAATPLSAADVQITAQGPVVELSVYEEVESRPDTVRITAGVQTDAPTAVEALRQNAQDMQRVIARIRAAGVADRDIQTTGLNLSPRWDYDQGAQRQVFRGYRAGNSVAVRFRDIAAVGPVLDALVAAGANDISGPVFSVENDEPFKAAARRAAMDRARRQAEEYARGAGYTGVRLLRIQEGLTGRTRAESRDIMVTAARLEAAPPIEPGVVGTGVTISVAYEMTR
ncbi:DUF541 domain-containing protein [Erythrobacteraceae bacterium CFH 75059]|uniref:SIMPL domain-containing protein n=1 Tax=Qipengyuania thermophila TaxID=2509361 RepID=UPI00101F3564|nr:SIMPL domain-containing protein [Qipengyuania thermophila]TCD04996.1 DUF541 domain-containing protein [Erythrobacteraceae bacterium CFH 75059]